MSFNSLCIDIIRVIINFIDEKELSFYVINKENYKLKYKIFLNPSYTKKYVSDMNFRSKIIEDYILKDLKFVDN